MLSCNLCLLVSLVLKALGELFKVVAEPLSGDLSQFLNKTRNKNILGSKKEFWLGSKAFSLCQLLHDISGFLLQFSEVCDLPVIEGMRLEIQQFQLIQCFISIHPHKTFLIFFFRYVICGIESACFLILKAVESASFSQ